MATSNPTLPAELAIRARWEASSKSHSNCYGDGLKTAASIACNALVDPYWQYTGEDEDSALGREWLEKLEEATQAAAIRAYEAFVVPAVIHEILAALPDAPIQLVSYPESTELRADIAATKEADR